MASMKYAIFIGNRVGVLNELLAMTDSIKLTDIFVLAGSFLAYRVTELNVPKTVQVHIFTMKDKARLLEQIGAQEFDLLLSNGCPFILPVSKLRKQHQLFINALAGTERQDPAERCFHDA